MATFDCDDDGLPDLYLAGGAGPAALFRNRSEVGGALRFERVADAATDLDAVTGAYPIDVDGDGTIDLAVLRLGEDVMLRGLGELPLRACQRGARARWRRRAGPSAFSATWEDAATAADARLRRLPRAR